VVRWLRNFRRPSNATNSESPPRRIARRPLDCEYNAALGVMRRVTETSPVSIDELRRLAGQRFGDLVKGVVDARRGIMLLDAELHADQEAELLAEGSAQSDLWGINLYPDVTGSDWLEFDSMINLRPSFGNRSRGVDDPATREAIANLVDRLVRR
jgi:hypothetical protein